MEIKGFVQKRMKRAGLVLGAILLFQTSLPLRGEIGLIRVYRFAGSPVMRYMVHCRFDPTCSEYALMSLEEDGFWSGNWRIVKRLAHCSPLGAAADYLRSL